MTIRCDFCRSSNPPGITWCEVCNARLPGIACALCGFDNPPGNIYCGQCGQALTIEGEPRQQATMDDSVPTVATEAQQKPQGTDSESPSVPVAYVVGFGAVLAVGSVAYPWYFLGNQAEFQAIRISIFHQFASGWEWFPGLPLVLIILSASLSTFLSILAQNGKASPVPSIFLGVISLVSAIWLWQGFIAERPATGELELTPMFATIGAIIIVVGGALMTRQFLARS